MSTSNVGIEPAAEADEAAPPLRPEADREIRRILGLSVPVSVSLAERDMPIKSILSLTVGSIIEFNIPFDADLTLRVANQPIGRGQAVKVGENFGLRMTSINDVHERIEALAGG
jgi:flagellar motor switch/type III secretory pathway protein FliN